MREKAHDFTQDFASHAKSIQQEKMHPTNERNTVSIESVSPRKPNTHANTRYLPRTRATYVRNDLCALSPLTKRPQCHYLSWLLGTLRVFDSRTRYTLEIRHFPRFFHEMSVPVGNATCYTENKHGGLELSKRKCKDVQNWTDYQRM